MPILKKAVLVLALITIVSTNHAQENDSEGSAAPDSELKNYENWSVQCVREQDSNLNSCALFSHLNLENGQRFLTFLVRDISSLDQSTESKFVAVITAPLGVYLPNGLRIQIDESDPISLEFERCDQNGCYAGTELGESLKAALKKGKECKVSFDNLERRTLTATLPLTGFTAGFNAL